MCLAWLGARATKPVCAVHRPAVDHLAGNFGVKLGADSILSIDEGRVRINITGGQHRRHIRDNETLPMPLIKDVGFDEPVSAYLGRIDPSKASFNLAVAVRPHFASQNTSQYLAPETEAKKWHFGIKNLRQEVQFRSDTLYRTVISAHWPPEHRDGRVVRWPRRQVVALTRASPVKPVTPLSEQCAYMVWNRIFLTNNEKNLFCHTFLISSKEILCQP